MFRRTRPLLAALALLAAACSSKATDTPADDVGIAEDTSTDASIDSGSADTTGLPVLATATGDTNFAIAANGWYRGDLHFHTNYSEDAKKQGGDNLKEALIIADAWRDPVFTQANPGSEATAWTSSPSPTTAPTRQWPIQTSSTTT